MAKDFETRRRERELEDEKEREEKEQRGKIPGKKGGPASGTLNSDDSGNFTELVARAEPLMEQVNNLYQQYIVGLESRPPVERRKQLEQLMATLQSAMKGTAANQFRYNSVQASYLSHRDRWDKLCRDLESGKIKRTVGPKRDR